MELAIEIAQIKYLNKLYLNELSEFTGRTIIIVGRQRLEAFAEYELRVDDRVFTDEIWISIEINDQVELKEPLVIEHSGDTVSSILGWLKYFPTERFEDTIDDDAYGSLGARIRVNGAYFDDLIKQIEFNMLTTIEMQFHGKKFESGYDFWNWKTEGARAIAYITGISFTTVRAPVVTPLINL